MNYSLSLVTLCDSHHEFYQQLNVHLSYLLKNQPCILSEDVVDTCSGTPFPLNPMQILVS